ncbi:MAG: AI-2E family transporter [Phycisphaeraceae bacterium]|nr:AI-2E family transporter [Phycisphaeraceae bacterium]
MSDANQNPSTGHSRSPGIDWRKHHIWQIQPVRDVLVVLLLVGLVYLGHTLSIVTVPLLLALLLAYLLEPVVGWLTRRTRMKRQTAVASLIIATLILVIVPAVIGSAVAFVQVAGAATSVAANSRNLLDSVRADTPESRQAAYDNLDGPGWRNVSDWLADLNDNVNRKRAANEPEGTEATDQPDAPSEDLDQTTPESLRIPIPFAESGRRGTYRVAEFLLGWVKDNSEAIGAAVGKRALGTGSDALNAALRAVGSVGYIAFTAFLTGFFFFFISTGYGKVLEFWRDLIPERKKGLAIDLGQKMNAAVSGFVRGRLTIAAIQSVVFAIGYLLIGVPGWIILGPLVAFLSIIPYAALIGVPISIILLYLHPNAFEFQEAVWWTFGAPIALYVAGQALDDYILTPAIQGKSTGMDTPTILFASLAGGALAGVYGLLIAIPVAACIKILLQELFWPRFKRWAQGKETDFLPISN